MSTSGAKETGTSAERVKARIAEVLHIPTERVTDEVALKDLVSESFVLVEMAIELQEDFGVRFSQEDLKLVRTVRDLVALVDSRRRR